MAKSLGFRKHNVPNIVVPNIIPTNKIKYFDSSLGFGKFKQTAIDLLKITIDILDEFHIDYFLISGTLLGCIRHNDFIPYDDDIDLIVSSDIKNHLQQIFEKYNDKISLISKDNIIKLCFKNKVINLNHCKIWSNYLLNTSDSYFWPFVDLFIYEKDSDSIKFFNRSWDIKQFFPIQKKDFNSILVSIPFNPDYFLSKNYGTNYMTILKSSNWNHKEECGITTQYTITFDEFKEKTLISNENWC